MEKDANLASQSRFFSRLVQIYNSVRKTGPRRAMFGRSPRANTTDLGPETLHVPSVGPKLPRTAFIPVVGA